MSASSSGYLSWTMAVRSPPSSRIRLSGSPDREEQRLLDAPIEFFVVHALPGEDRDAGLGDRGGGVILRREDVAAAPGDFGAELDRAFRSSTAVWIVMCRQPAMRAPLSGLVRPYFSRSAIRPGISFSASQFLCGPIRPGG